MSENQPEMALFQLIAEALTPEGTLPKDFSLPKEKAQNKLIFADGAMDGIKLYHTQPKEGLSVRRCCLSARARKKLGKRS